MALTREQIEQGTIRKELFGEIDHGRGYVAERIFRVLDGGLRLDCGHVVGKEEYYTLKKPFPGLYSERELCSECHPIDFRNPDFRFENKPNYAHIAGKREYPQYMLDKLCSTVAEYIVVFKGGSEAIREKAFDWIDDGESYRLIARTPSGAEIRVVFSKTGILEEKAYLPANEG